jgi:glycosyltransferase involved in cell wall biosynthesis
MNLSILIPTLISRKGFLNRILESLENQIVHNHLQNKIEILVCSDNKEMTTGAKRNHLTNKAQGKFRAFVDDDDKVSDNYCITINNIIEEKGDSINYIGFKLKYVHNGDHNYKPALHTLTTGHTEWAEDSQYYYRPINHLNPMKTSTAKKVLFPDVTIYEDRD